MNKVELVGNLTRDPDVRYSTTSGNDPLAIARYTLAVSRRHRAEGEQQTADFISCVAFGRQGEFAEKYLHKGMKIAIIGRIQTGSYTKEDGTKVYTTDIVVEEHEFVESKSASEENKNARDAAAAQAAGYSVDENGFMQIPEGLDEELPFN